MSDEGVKSIQVMIAGRSYPLKIQAVDEPGIVKVADALNAKIRQFQSMYAHLDQQDYLSMALLTYAVDFHKVQERREDQVVLDKLAHLDTLLEEALM
jgi:cell division protein ZapA (FtsZ GTPase activity inhibitor)